LLDLDLGAGLLELLYDVLGLGLVDADLDILGSAVNQIFRILEAQAGDFTNDLDDADLVGPTALQDHGELGLLLNRGGSCTATTSSRRRGNRDRSRLDAPLVLERLRQADEVDDGEVREVGDDFILRDRHGCLSFYVETKPTWLKTRVVLRR